MEVFAWILFIITALTTLGSLLVWFNDGELEGLFTTIGSIAGLVYFIFYLFVAPFGVVATWIYFIAAAVFTLIALIARKIFPLVLFSAYTVFFALVLFI